MYHLTLPSWSLKQRPRNNEGHTSKLGGYQLAQLSALLHLALSYLTTKRAISPFGTSSELSRSPSYSSCCPPFTLTWLFSPTLCASLAVDAYVSAHARPASRQLSYFAFWPANGTNLGQAVDEAALSQIRIMCRLRRAVLSDFRGVH